MNPTYYDILGVAPTATPDELKQAFRDGARRMHPDVSGNERQFATLKYVYDVLKDPSTRATYDAGLAVNAPSPQSEDERVAEAEPVPWGEDSEWNPSAEDDQPTAPWSSPKSDDTVTVVPDYRVGRRSARIAWGVWAALVTTYVVVSLIDPPIDVLSLLLPIPLTAALVPKQCRQTLPAPRLLFWLSVVGWVMVGLAALGAAQLVQAGASVTEWWVFVALVVGAVVVRVLSARRWEIIAINREVGPVTVDSHNLFGSPGQRGRHGRQDVADASTSAQLLEVLLEIPGSKLINEMSGPSGIEPDIDQVVICGRRVALVKAVRWPPGHYRSDSYGQLLRDERQTGWTRPHMVGCANQLGTEFPRAEVRSFVLVLSEGAQVDLDGVEEQYVFASEVGPVIGSWLEVGAGVVDRPLLARLLR